MLLNPVLEKYLSDLEKAIRMANESLLEINEAVVADSNLVRHLGYRYHLQDGKNNLLFRYDNTPHFPELPSYPHHKHLLDKVHETGEPNILDVINEACSIANVQS